MDAKRPVACRRYRFYTSGVSGENNKSSEIRENFVVRITVRVKCLFINSNKKQNEIVSVYRVKSAVVFGDGRCGETIITATSSLVRPRRRLLPWGWSGGPRLAMRQCFPGNTALKQTIIIRSMYIGYPGSPHAQKRKTQWTVVGFGKHRLSHKRPQNTGWREV